MNKTIITTVGTSVITNYLKVGNKQVSTAYETLQNVPFFGLSKDDADYHLKSVQSIQRALPDFCDCAEISSISAIKNELEESLEDGEILNLTIHLLCTDTLLSPLCAEVIAKYFRKNGYSVKFEEVAGNETIISKIKDKYFSSEYIIRDLRVDSNNNYEKGFMNLIEQLDKLNLSKNDILNITGGYKAIIPILTLYGQLKEIPLKYLYNDSDLDKPTELVTVGNLPFGLDWAVVEVLKPYLNHYFLSKKEVVAFVGYWFEGDIIYLNGNFKGKNEEASTYIKSKKHNLTLLNLICSIINYRLIIWDKENSKVLLSSLGLIVSDVNDKRVPLNTIKGQIMEHILFKFFSLNSKDNCVTDKYQINTSIPKLKKGEKQNGIELGDIDLYLTHISGQKTHDVWAEVKAKSSAESYGKDDYKYYKQLKERVLYLKYSFLETLLITYRFVIEGMPDEPFLTPNLNKSLLVLQQLNADVDLENKTQFKCIGVTIPIKISNNKLNLTESFYKADFSNWKWEELHPKEDLD